MIVAAGVISLATLYVVPTLGAFILPSPPSTLPSLSVPVAWFPPLATPKLHAAPVLPHVKPAPHTRLAHTTPRHATRKHVPVARQSYSFAPPSSSAASPTASTYVSSPVVDALAAAITSATVTTDQTGTPTQIGPNTSPGATDAGVGVDPTTLAPGSTTQPDAVVDPNSYTPPAPPDDRTPATASPSAASPAPTTDSTGDASATPPVTYEAAQMISNATAPVVSTATVVPHNDTLVGSPAAGSSSDAAATSASTPASPPQDVVTPSVVTPPTIDAGSSTSGSGNNTTSPGTDITAASSPSGPSISSPGPSGPSDGSATPGSDSVITAAAAPGGAGGASSVGPSTAAAGDGTVISGDGSTSVPTGADGAPLDPSAVPGSGRGPPSTWNVDATGSVVTVAVSNGNLVVTVNGVASTRSVADVSALAIAGARSLTVDLSGGSLAGIPITYGGSLNAALTVVGSAGTSWTFDGGAGTVSADGLALSYSNVSSLSGGAGVDTLHGPAADTVWHVTGAGSGAVGGATFSGFENLVGAAGNRDQFVFGAHGALAGGIDGGPGGFDTLVVDGGSYRNVGYRTIDRSSGSVVLDGSVIHYTGLEPVVVTGTGANQEYSGTSSDDAIVIADDVDPNSFTITSNTSESITIQNADQLSSLTLDGLGGNDSVTFNSIDSAFAGTIFIHGGSGSNSLIAGNSTGGAWNLTGIDSGTYTPTGGPTIGYDGVGNLNGGSGPAAFTFGLDGGVSGSLTSGGNVSLSFAGLLTVSGSGGFAAYSGASDTLAGDTATTTGLSVIAAHLTGANVFLGTGNGTASAQGAQQSIADIAVALVADTANNRAWAAAKGSDTNVTVDFNSVASDGSAVDFTTLDTDPVTAGQQGLTVGSTSFTDATAQLSATFTTPSFDVAGIASGHAASVTVAGAIVNADTNGDSTVDAHHALRVDLSATGADVTVGVSGFGVEVTGTVALELLIATESGDSRVWIAASGSSLGTTVALGPVSATLSNVSLLVNSASGADAAHNAATAIQDWTTATVGGTLTFASPGAFAHVSGHVDTLDVAGVAEGAATSFDITQSTVSNSGLSLTDAKLVHFAVTGLTGAIGGSGYGVTVSGDLTVDALSDTLSSKRWLAAYGHNLSLDVELAPLQISATAATLKLNRATNATVISDWSPFDTSLPTFPSSGDYLDVSGSVTTITIGGFASVSVPTVSLTRASGVSTPVGAATLSTLTLNGIQLNAGSTGTALTINGGNLAAYALTDGTHSWFAVDGSGFAVHAVLGPLTLDASSGVAFQLNTHSAGAAALADWSSFTPLAAFPAADYFHLSATGSTTVSIAGFASVTVGGFSLTRMSGVSGPGTTGTGTVFALHLTGATVDAGSGALTLTLTAGTLDVYGFSVDATHSWFAAEGSGFSVHAVAGPLQLDAAGGHFSYNTDPGSQPITDWSFATGPASIAAASFDVTVSGGITIAVAPFVSATAATFDLSRQTGVTGSGTSGTGTLVTVGLTGLSLDASAAGASLTIGGGASDMWVFMVGSSTWSAITGSGFSVSLSAGPLTAAASGASFAYNTQSDQLVPPITDWSFAPRGPPSLQGNYFHLAATAGLSLTLTGFASVTLGSLDLTRGPAQATTELGGAPLSGTLFTLQLGGIGFSMVSGTIGLSGGNLGLAVFRSGTNSWVAAHGDSFGLTLHAGALSASGTVNFDYNSGPAGNQINDWSFASVSGLGSSVADDLLEVSGSNVHVTLGSLLDATVVGFDAVSKTLGSSVATEGAAIAAGASLFTLTLTDLGLSVAGGAISLTHGNLGVAVVTSGASTWIGAHGDSFGLTLTAGALHADGSNLGFNYNTGPVGQEIHDWTFASVHRADDDG